MKAIYKAPNEQPKLVDIDNTLEALQAAVGGYIETITIASDACIICNEEGRLLNLPFNCIICNEEGRLLNLPFNCRLCGRVFVGPLLIVGVDGDEFTDLKRPEESIRYIFGEARL